MQTYELKPGRSIDEVLRDLTEIGSHDREIVLMVPPGNEMLSQVENLSRLRRFVLAQNITLRTVVADRVALGLFRIMGFEVDEARSGNGVSGLALPDDDYLGVEETVSIAPAAPETEEEWTPDEPLEVGQRTVPVAIHEIPAIAAAAPSAPAASAATIPPVETPRATGPLVAPNGTKLKMKVKTQFVEGSTNEMQEPPAPEQPRRRNSRSERNSAASAPPPAVRRWEPPATYSSVAPQPAPAVSPVDSVLPTRSVTGKLKMKIKTNRGETVIDDSGSQQPETVLPPAVATAPSNPPVAAPFPLDPEVEWDVQSSMAASSEVEQPEEEYPPEEPVGLDVTMSGWLQGEPAPAPPTHRSSAPPSGLDVTLPAWMADEQEPGHGATPDEAAAGAPVPAWLHESSTGATTASANSAQVPSVPAWLRQEEAPPRPPVVPAVPAPELPDINTPADFAVSGEPVGGTDAALTAEAVKDAAIAQAGGASLEGRALPPMDLAALAGPLQTTELKAAAVREAGIDGRTRALLLFGMALVRLAVPEAQAAAASARRLGGTDEDLRLVVQMAQAIGGGPSERLGRRIISQAG